MFSSKNNLPPFEFIFDKYKQKIFNLIYRLLNDSHQAENLTQETFLRAYKAYNNFRQEADVYSWLYCIALNLCRKKIRQLSRKKKNPIISLDQTFEDKDGNQINKQIPDPSSNTPLEKKGIYTIKSPPTISVWANGSSATKTLLKW